MKCLTEDHMKCLTEDRMKCLAEDRMKCLTEDCMKCLTEDRMKCLAEDHMKCLAETSQYLPLICCSFDPESNFKYYFQGSERIEVRQNSLVHFFYTQWASAGAENDR